MPSWAHLRPKLHMRLCSAADESRTQPKFAFAFGEPQTDSFTFTKIALNMLRNVIEQDACECVKRAAMDDERFWAQLQLLSREAFWLQNSPQPAMPEQPVFPVLQQDAPLCFEGLAWILLKYEAGHSFLHVNSGSGYACTIAALQQRAGASGTRIFGVEFRPDFRHRARHNAEVLVRFRPEMRRIQGVPMFHADFPEDLATGAALFDRVLVTDCFQRLQDVLQLKRLLAPDGRLVTGFMRVVNHKTTLDMVVVFRTERLGERVVIEDVTDDDNSGPSFKRHLAPARFKNIFLFLLRAQLSTAARLQAARRRPRAAVECAMPSLQTLAQRRCSVPFDVIGRLLGELRIKYIMRVSPRFEQLPDLTAQLGAVRATYETFHRWCFAASWGPLTPAMSQSAERVLCRLTAALDALQRAFIGADHHDAWRNGEPLELPVLHGVMVWLCESVFHAVNFSGYLRNPCFQVPDEASASNSSSPDDDAPLTVNVGRPLLNAILSYFRSNFFFIMFDDTPWSYQLSYPRLMRRTLTRLAARFWADASWMVTIVKAILEQSIAANGKRAWHRAIHRNLQEYTARLARLYHRLMTWGDRFVSMKVLLRVFADLKPHMRRMRNDANVLNDLCEHPEVQALFARFLPICASALRNPVGGGRVQDARTGERRSLKFLRGAGSLLDLQMFHEARANLTGGDPPDAVTSEDVSAFLARRLKFDLKEAMWITTSCWAERWLALFERDMELHARMLTLHRMNRPEYNIMNIFEILRLVR